MSVMTKSQMRYEGILAAIDPATSTIEITRVRVMGTEGRRNGDGEVPPQAGEYASVKFVGTDIVDLRVLAAAATTAGDLAAMDPAVAAATVSAPAPAPAPPAAADLPAPSSAPSAGRARVARSPPVEDPTAGYAPGTGDFAAHATVRGAKGGAPAAAPPASTFDIQASTEAFDKEAERERALDGAPAATGTTRSTAYNRGSSFFDTLSSSTMETGEDARTARQAEERRRNAETFGAEGLSTSYGERFAARRSGGGYGGDRGGDGGGRGRRGRGRGRGGGRGGAPAWD